VAALNEMNLQKENDRNYENVSYDSAEAIEEFMEEENSKRQKVQTVVDPDTVHHLVDNVKLRS